MHICKYIHFKVMEKSINSLIGVRSICEVTKRRSPLTTMFYYSEVDPFLVNYCEYRKATGLITYEAMITFPELDSRLEKMKKTGCFVHYAK